MSGWRIIIELDSGQCSEGLWVQDPRDAEYRSSALWRTMWVNTNCASPNPTKGIRTSPTRLGLSVMATVIICTTFRKARRSPQRFSFRLDWFCETSGYLLYPTVKVKALEWKASFICGNAQIHCNERCHYIKKQHNTHHLIEFTTLTFEGNKSTGMRTKISNHNYTNKRCVGYLTWTYLYK